MILSVDLVFATFPRSIVETVTRFLSVASLYPVLDFVFLGLFFDDLLNAFCLAFSMLFFIDSISLSSLIIGFFGRV